MTFDQQDYPIITLVLRRCGFNFKSVTFEHGILTHILAATWHQTL